MATIRYNGEIMGFGELITPANSHPPYITITKGMRGYFAVHVTWNPDGFYEPYDTGIGSFPSASAAEPEAKMWAEEEGIEYRPPEELRP